ncbi:membrane protein insertion efficiency factor YidD [Bdellovibrionota bacterium FG-1]
MLWLFRSLTQTFLSLFFFIYQVAISPLIHTLAGPGYGCRFEPSCSQYGKQALETHGLWRGSGLALRRICRCHPFGRKGWDPVPSAGFLCASTSDIDRVER